MKLGITMLIHNKDDIEFVTEFPSFLGHPVHEGEKIKGKFIKSSLTDSKGRWLGTSSRQEIKFLGNYKDKEMFFSI